jgi:hypothetical protein
LVGSTGGVGFSYGEETDSNEVMGGEDVLLLQAFSKPIRNIPATRSFIVENRTAVTIPRNRPPREANPGQEGTHRAPRISLDLVLVLFREKDRSFSRNISYHTLDPN